jgi:amino acid adenylation domain-containing protein/thioester reductase-like protein
MATRNPNLEAIYPLSNMQQGMLFHTLLEPEAGLYFEQYTFRCNPDVDTASLRRAWEKVVERHAILRTLFVWEKRKQPLQAVRRTVTLGWEELDLRSVAPQQQAVRFERFLEEDRRRGFDLTKAPLMRVAIVRLSETDLRMVWSRHHLLLDGWSVAIVLNDLFDYYEAFVAGREIEKAPPPPFQNYIAWLQGQDSTRAESFWRQYLDGFSEPTLPPADRPVSLKDEYYNEQENWLPEDTTANLRDFARRHRLTVNMLVQAAWALVLQRYTGKDEVVFGATVAGRPYDLPGVNEMVGVFINTLPIRVKIPEKLPAVEWVQQIAGLALEREPFEHSPLADIQQWSDTGGANLFESILIFENLPDVRAERILQMEGVGGYERSNYPLTVVGLPGRELGLRIAYDGRYSHAAITRMLNHFQNFLLAIVNNPNVAVDELSPFEPAEEARLRAGAFGAQDWDTDLCAHRLFEQQVALYPDVPAVMCGDSSLSYAELNERANRLADYLIQKGVTPGAKVGICTNRSLNMLAGLLGILKTGAAYVPLNPSYPPDRQAFMLQDAGATILLAEQDVAEKLPPSGFATVFMDSLALSDYSDQNPALELSQDLPSHIIYTSGSTGTPRGVVSTHRAVVNLGLGFLVAHNFTPENGAGQRWLMIPHISFSASIGDLFPALFNGMTLVLHPDPAALIGNALMEFCNRYRVNIINTAVALWRQWVETLPPVAEFTTLHTLMVGGESAGLRVLERWAKITGGRVTFFNHYGQTEVNSCCTVYRTTEGREIAAAHLPNVPIGTPIPNAKVWVLDARLRPLPVGVPGDLYIAGPTLAAGYLNRPDLDEQQFIANPFGVPGEKLYKTGDLARWLPDGVLDFLGRSDQQVKIRGYRVEPAEIEAVLKSAPGVRECVVMVRELASTGEKYLTGYVVPVNEAHQNPAEIRAYLSHKLPDYMIPAHFVFLPALPLNVNGKLDRQALPAPDTASRDATAKRPPATPTEIMLATLWGEVLGQTEIGADANFFETGGHSLKAAQAMARLNEGSGLNLPLRAIFERPVLADLARYLDEVKAGGASDAPVVDLRAEAIFDMVIDPEIVASGANYPPKAILLTGATGFLGSYLLAELLRQTDATLYCFVRATDAATGFERIQQTLASYKLWQDRPDYARRIVPVPGDLALSGLGLDEATYAKLATEVDLILHNGGTVNFLQTYAALKSANVEGTKEILRLATTHHLKAVHFVSTLSIFLAAAYRNKIISEQTPPSVVLGMHESYTESKWVADSLMQSALLRGVPVSIYRPARITGASDTGISNLGDLLARYWKGCIELGRFPADSTFDVIPVDYLAAAIVHLLRQPENAGRTFHFFNPDLLHVDTLAQTLARRGYEIELLPYDSWYEAVLNSPEDNALRSILPLLARREADIEKQPDFDCSATFAALENAPFRSPPVDERLVECYLDYMEEKNFLPQRQAAGV